MHFNIITNMDEGCGLRHDHDILRDLITARGHTVQSRDFRNIDRQRADVNIFLEVQVPQLFGDAKQNWLVPNPEWFFGNASNFELILCKTRHAQRLFNHEIDRSRVRYIGFESRDMLALSQSEIYNTRFLHVAGKSDMKNTEAVLSAWLNFGIEYPLTLITSLEKFASIAHSTPNVTHHYKLSDADLRLAMTSHRFHLCPSKTEGWGHYIHEALSTGAVVISTDAAPMNEIEGVYDLLPSQVTGKLRMSDVNTVIAPHIYESVLRVAALDSHDVRTIAHKARVAWRIEQTQFRGNIEKLLSEAECL